MELSEKAIYHQYPNLLTTWEMYGVMISFHEVDVRGDIAFFSWFGVMSSALEYFVLFGLGSLCVQMLVFHFNPGSESRELYQAARVRKCRTPRSYKTVSGADLANRDIGFEARLLEMRQGQFWFTEKRDARRKNKEQYGKPQSSAIESEDLIDPNKEFSNNIVVVQGDCHIGAGDDSSASGSDEESSKKTAVIEGGCDVDTGDDSSASDTGEDLSASDMEAPSSPATPALDRKSKWAQVLVVCVRVFLC